jgi:hypothetical protein
MLEDLERISSGEPLSGEQLDEYYQRRLIEFIIILYLRNALPDRADPNRHLRPIESAT